jgi:N1-aminopropylagmatine ureohydrolase
MNSKPWIPFGGFENQVSDVESAAIVILPLCHEYAPSYGTGSGQGPNHILDASVQLESIDERTLIDWTAYGIHTARPVPLPDDPEAAVKEMAAAAAHFLSMEKFLLSLGGDHAASIGPITAAANIFSNLGVLQIDAHLDLRDVYNGSRYNHACVMRRVAEDVRVPFVQVGIRSFSKEELQYIEDRGIRPVFAHDISPINKDWIDRAVRGLPEKVYMTIDLDGLDPSVLPGTGTPEPGGLSYRQLVDLIETVGQKRQVVAADITELSKIEGSCVSEFTAAKIATKIFVHCL